MMRVEGWNEEHDIILAETVLNHVRKGLTQIKAFEEAANKLNRSTVSCGYRWNAYVIKDYQHAIEIAKKERVSSDKQIKTQLYSIQGIIRTNMGKIVDNETVETEFISFLKAKGYQFEKK